jgi:hypothetical protein
MPNQINIPLLGSIAAKNDAASLDKQQRHQAGTK